jgi:peroxiredoxin
MGKSLLQLRNETLAAFSSTQTAAYRHFVLWLKENGITDQVLKENDRAPDFILPDANGRLVSSLELREKGPLVISFFRGDWCPFCAAELCALQAALPRIHHLKANLVAISPDTGEFPRLLKRNLNLNKLQILADVDFGVSLAFGVIFSVPDEIRGYFRENGIDLPIRHGLPAWMLPIPATYVIDGSGIIRSAYVEPDFTLRQEPSAIVERLERLVGDAPTQDDF